MQIICYSEVWSFVLLQAVFKLLFSLVEEQGILYLLNQRICLAGQMEYMGIHGKFLLTFLEEEMSKVKSIICMWEGR